MTLGTSPGVSKLSMLMNQLGHSESYFFSLELETALAEALEQADIILTPQIIRNPHHLS